MPDALEQRKVRRRIGVGERAIEVDLLGGGQRPHRGGLRRAICVELDLAGVAPGIVDLGTRRDRAVRTEVVGQRVNDLGRRRRYEEHPTAGTAMGADEVERLVVHDGLDDLVQRVLDERSQPGLVPAAGDAKGRLPDLGHATVVGPERPEHDLAERRPHGQPAGDVTLTAQRAPVGEQ